MKRTVYESFFFTRNKCFQAYVHILWSGALSAKVLMRLMNRCRPSRRLLKVGFKYFHNCSWHNSGVAV